VLVHIPLLLVRVALLVQQLLLDTASKVTIHHLSQLHQQVAVQQTVTLAFRRIAPTVVRVAAVHKQGITHLRVAREQRDRVTLVVAVLLVAITLLVAVVVRER
jgi:hypothetical protein